MPNMLTCAHFQAGNCTSCLWIEKPYSVQLVEKEADSQAVNFAFYFAKYDRNSTAYSFRYFAFPQ